MHPPTPQKYLDKAEELMRAHNDLALELIARHLQDAARYRAIRFGSGIYRVARGDYEWPISFPTIPASPTNGDITYHSNFDGAVDRYMEREKGMWKDEYPD